MIPLASFLELAFISSENILPYIMELFVALNEYN